MALLELFGDTLLVNTRDGILSDVKTEDLVTADVVGIYFSVSWSPPCKMFTQALKNSYKLLRAEYKRFVIIYVPCEDQEAALPYFNSMPWLSVNPEDRDICDSLRRKFEVTGVPRLVLISTNGDIIVNNARNADFFSLDVSKETVMSVWHKIVTIALDKGISNIR